MTTMTKIAEEIQAGLEDAVIGVEIVAVVEITAGWAESSWSPGWPGHQVAFNMALNDYEKDPDAAVANAIKTIKRRREMLAV